MAALIHLPPLQCTGAAETPHRCVAPVWHWFIVWRKRFERHTATVFLHRPPKMLLFGTCIAVSPETYNDGRRNQDGGTGWVRKVHPDGSFDIQYSLDKRIEKNVSRRRISSLTPPATTARTVNGGNEVTRPSLLTPYHVPADERLGPRPRAAAVSPLSPNGVASVLLNSRGWSKFDQCHNPLLVFLKEGRSPKKPEGWLRLVEKEYDTYAKSGKGKKKGEMKSQLSELENNKLVRIKTELDRLFSGLGAWPKSFNPTSDLAHAYGVSVPKVKACVTVHLSKNCSSKRKERSDKGETLFNSEKKRQAIITPYNHFAKHQRKKYPEENLSDKELKAAYRNLSPEDIHQCELGAAAELTIATNIVAEVKRALDRTNGSISWERLAAFVAGGEGKVQPVSRTAIQSYVTSTQLSLLRGEDSSPVHHGPNEEVAPPLVHRFPHLLGGSEACGGCGADRVLPH